MHHGPASGLLRVISDSFGVDCRLADVRFDPVSVRLGPVRTSCVGWTPVIQTLKLGARIRGCGLAKYEWVAIKPMLPNKPRGVPRVNDRRVLNGIFWVLRSGAHLRFASVIRHRQPVRPKMKAVLEASRDLK